MTSKLHFGLTAIALAVVAFFACKSSSSGPSGSASLGTCRDVNLTCATNGECPNGQAIATGVNGVRTCDGTENAESCCAPCTAPNVVQDGLCVFAGAAACTNMNGYCASPPDDAGADGACEPGDLPIGQPGMCGDGKTYPVANCCAFPDGGVDTDAQDDASPDAPDGGG